MKHIVARGVMIGVVFLTGAVAVRAADPDAQNLRDELDKLRRQQKELAGQIEQLAKRLDGGKPIAQPLTDGERAEALDKLVREVVEQREQALDRVRRLETEVALLRDGHPFAKLKPGMTEGEVEKLIGKPERVDDGDRRNGGKWVPVRQASYHVVLSDKKTGYLMTVEYRKGKGGWAYRDWDGPHVPNDR